MKHDKPVVFLDIDGVLATNREFMMNPKKFKNKHPLAKELNFPYPFCPVCVNIFNEILIETDADIVLSSDWRKDTTLNDLDRIFQFNNVIKSPVNVTKNLIMLTINYERKRNDEIRLYLKENEVGTYVVIDDLQLDFYNMDRFVKTTESEGVKQLSIKKKILNYLNESQ